ncbi:MAG: Wzz/FepE/Etk N-terminal domain-containing protein [Patescibacteria group bacterium]
MELKEYLLIVNKHKSLVVFLTVTAALVSFLISYFKPVAYEASLSFAVNRTNREETSQYQYDGYYAIQASDLVSQTVVSWFSTPSVVKEIYAKAGINPTFNSMNKYATLFNTKKYSGQNIGVKFTEKEEGIADKVAQAAVDVIRQKVLDLNKSADSKSLFEAVPSPAVIVAVRPNTILNTVIGFLAGLFVSLLLVYLIDYFKDEKKDNL